MHQTSRRRLFLASLVILAVLALTAVTSANHSWNGYHWARQSNPFTVQLGDNVSGAWDSVLRTTSSDWSQSTVLDTVIVPGAANKRNCRPTSGRVEVCNDTYGNNGWLGVAQVWVSGSHITQGTVKLNDTYFNTSTYNTTAWRNLVSCQEVGHTFGLDHQDENFNNPNLGTCMDYTNDPSTNQHPNKHDYDELVTIYSHLDSTSTLGQIASRIHDFVQSAPPEWGKLIRHSPNGKNSLFELDLGHGRRVFTFVIWA
jgi:hypothetical protein